MPEYVMPIESTAAHMRWRALDPFTQGYIEAALFTFDESFAEELGRDLFDVPFDLISDEALASIKADCEAFLMANSAAIGDAPEDQAGRDYWFTRNGAGVGYWDRAEGTYANAAALTDAARAAGERTLYPGDDGKLYIA